MIVTEQDELSELFNALFLRMVSYLFETKCSHAAHYSEKSGLQVHCEQLLYPKGLLEKEFFEWEEWIAFEARYIEITMEKPNCYYACHLINDLIWELNIFGVAHQFTHIQYVPNLDAITVNKDILNKSILTLPATFTSSEVLHYAILIQGLEVTEKIDVGCGYFSRIDPEILRHKGFFYNPNDTDYLKSVFYTKCEKYVDFDFILTLMAALRTYKEGDIRFHTVFIAREHAVKKYVYQPYRYTTNANDYFEETALFGTRPPTLLRIENIEQGSLTKHIGSFLNNSSKMKFSCQLFNDTILGNLNMVLPMGLMTIESLFPDSSIDKSNRHTFYVTNMLNESVEFSKMFKLLYKMRNGIIHGDKSYLDSKRSEFNNEYRQAYGTPEQALLTILKKLLVILVSKKWNPRNDTKKLKRIYESKKNR
jgi:hypothetical protein